MTAAPQHESAHGRPATTDELAWEALLSPDAGGAAPAAADAAGPAAIRSARRGGRPPKIDLLDGLNPSQREAVLHEGAPVLVVAGAGSGKTRVLTRRIAYLVGERKVHPGSVLAITFTNKAAAEMRHRVAELIGNRAKLMWISTFHSACVRILRSEINRFGLSRTFSIYDDADSKRLMQLVLTDLQLDPKKFPVRAVMTWVSNHKNELVDHETAATRAETEIESSNAAAYAEYQRRLAAANALDFDDIIMTTVHLLQAFPELREQYRRRFRHVLVDEYQDTNHAQYVLIRELCSADVEPPPGELATEPPELMVVGDSDQSIYAFRGATIRNILDFESDFPGARTILLEQNYRSTQTILNAANAVIVQNEGRKPKSLWSDAGDGHLITGYVADSEHDEAQFVAGEIDKLRDDHGIRYGDVAVFYRTNAQSRAFEEVFIRVGMPYKVVGGVRFYERREVRDAIAYLRAIANRADDVSLRRILNVPKRGIGDKAEGAVAELAARERISFGDALRRVDEISGLASRSARLLTEFAGFMDDHEAMVAADVPADQILLSVLEKSGYLTELGNSEDPQDETRLENLQELIGVAREFVAEATPVGPGDFELSAEDLAGLTVEELAELAQLTGVDPQTGELAVPNADRAPGGLGRRRGRRPGESRRRGPAARPVVGVLPGAGGPGGRQRPDPRPGRVGGGGHADDPAHRQGAGVRHRLPDRSGGCRLPAPALARRQGRARAGGGEAAGVRGHHPRPGASLPDPGHRPLGLGGTSAQPAQPVPGRDPRSPGGLATAGFGGHQLAEHLGHQPDQLAAAAEPGRGRRLARVRLRSAGGQDRAHAGGRGQGAAHQLRSRLGDRHVRLRRGPAGRRRLRLARGEATRCPTRADREALAGQGTQPAKGRNVRASDPACSASAAGRPRCRRRPARCREGRPRSAGAARTPVRSGRPGPAGRCR